MNQLHGSRKVSTVPNSSTSLILGDDATRNMIKVTAVRPDLRQKRIKDALKSRNDAFKNDPYAQGFGISVQENFSVIGARILDPPSVSYGTKKNNNLKLAQPKDGKWRASSHFVSAQSLNSWAVLDTANLTQYGHSQSEKKLGVGDKYHRSSKVHSLMVYY